MADAPIRHRLTAILAADAAGFSRLMAADERATLTALDAARAVFRAQIEAHQGRVIDMAGDSVLAVFETATGAVDAALQIQQALTLSASAEAERVRMAFRIGVHLGDVIEKHDGTVYGDGVNVAARLEGLAEPGGIVVSDAVRGVVNDRVSAGFADKGPQALKNIARPIRAFAIVPGGGAAVEPPRAEAATLPDAALTAPLAPAVAAAKGDGGSPSSRASPRPAGAFVGRKPELAQLSKALQAARKGFGRVVLLAGSGGIGKTRLAQQLALQAEQGGTPVLWGRCPEEAGAPAYWPWRQAIRSYLRGAADPDLAQTFGSGLADIAGIVPEVAEHFKLRPAAAAPAGDSAQTRFRLFDAIAAFWRRAAQRAPLLLIFEDLHWADATSLRLFSFLVAELEDSALLVVGTYRDTELSRQHPLFETLSDLARSSACQRIELTGLSLGETEEMMLAASRAGSANFVRALHERTEGHPLFLQETLRYMTDARAPQAFDPGADDSRWLSRIPTGVREVIGKRLNRLSLPAARFLSIAACIGRDFDLHLLAQLEADKSEDELMQALEEALNEHLIEIVPDSEHFRFGHALIRETLYDEMLGLRRSRLHLRIGEILEQRHGADDAAIWPQLAYHFSEAGPGVAASKALGYAKRAADHAASLLAFEEAARLYQLALQLLKRHFAADRSERCAVRLALADAQTWVGVPETAIESYQQAAELARQAGTSGQFSRAAIGFALCSTAGAGRSGKAAVALLLEAIALHQGDDAMRVELTSRLCVAYVYWDREELALEAHRRAVALARQVGDQRSLFLALASIASAGYWPALLQQRVAAADEAWAIAEDLDLPERLVSLLTFYLCDLMRAGHAPRLAEVLAQGLRLTEQRRAYHWLSMVRQIETAVAICEGRFDDAEAAAVRALHAGRRVDEDKAVGAYGMMMFCLRREQGRLREALPLLQQFVREAPRANHWTPGLALLYAELDMLEPCRAAFDSLPWHRATLPPSDGATMTTFMLVAEVCVHLGDRKRAPLLYNLLQGHAGANLLADTSGPCLGRPTACSAAWPR